MPEILAMRSSLNRRVSDLEKENILLRNQVNQLRPLANLGLTFSMAAHELNNVLTPIGSYAQLALANPEDYELAEKVQKKTVKNCLRANKILQKVLGYVAGKSDHTKELHSLSKLVANVFDCITRDFSKDGIKVEIDIENDLQIYAVDIDIEQLLMNLILNARDAMLGRGGRLLIKAFSDNDNIVIQIRDTGKGIEAGQLNRIFEPFYTTKSNEKDSLGGSGLGLSFCREIVESYDGSISVESKPGTMTVFKIIFAQNPSAIH